MVIGFILRVVLRRAAKQVQPLVDLLVGLRGFTGGFGFTLHFLLRLFELFQLFKAKALVGLWRRLLLSGNTLAGFIGRF